jgi:hypothetical protein
MLRLKRGGHRTTACTFAIQFAGRLSETELRATQHADPPGFRLMLRMQARPCRTSPGDCAVTVEGCSPLKAITYCKGTTVLTALR